MYEKHQAKAARKKARMGHGLNGGGYPKLLITGLPGCGKTTAVRRIVAELDRNRVSGFYTQEIREEGIRRGFQWNSLDGTSGILAHTDINGPRKVSKYGVDVTGFENSILPLLDPKQAGVELFVIDEIGKMECLSGKFTETVRKLFASNKAILATVAQKGADLISEVKTYPKVRVFTLKRETHDNTVNEILELLSFLREP